MGKCCVILGVLRKSTLSSDVLVMAVLLSLALLTSSAPTGKLLRIFYALRFRSVLFISCHVIAAKSLWLT